MIDPAAISASVLPLPAVNVAAHRDGVCIAQGSLDYVMGHPANAVLWLARELEALGRQLRNSMQELMELGGWKSYQIVLRYAHLAPEHLSAAAQRIERVFGGCRR